MSDPTVDPTLRSFLEIPDGSPFPIQNLPYGVFRRTATEPPRVGVAIGDEVLDCAALEARRLFDGPNLAGKRIFDRPSLNPLMALGRDAWREARARISRLLSRDEPLLRDDATLRGAALIPRAEVELLLPVEIGDYTDFYSSREHATNVGTMFRGPDNALMPNWLHVPVAYHGRSSSVVLSGVDVRRPMGQTKRDDEPGPRFGPSRRLDIELEMGFFVGPGNRLGEPIPVGEAEKAIFGMVLVNDWSARDIQKWEYVPLGPFLAKNFATSISPWVVTLDALEPFRCAGPEQDPEPLPYLRSEGERTFDIELEVSLQTEKMAKPQRIIRSNFRHLYWNMAQQLAHHSITGCNMRPGDLLASGTISGPSKESRGSLLELSWAGKEPIELPGGETRTFLENGDRITMTGWCRKGGRAIGFGEVTTRILPELG
ncbi:MAG: fumarylacetoacetase [Candidatus Eisenbacteria bacterium]|nr:fumarylacetoacetase [Candidatus Latescibacterota bacterium]MBD3301891.1 fumarylacetoacetase [Candidatus Eisenbacteria bacterium]